MLEVQRSGCFCLLDGREIFARTRAGGEPVTVGDSVRLEQTGEDFLLREVLPRRSCFYRLATDPDDMRRQPAAANFDYVLIMQALGHDFNVGRLERYLAAAWQSGGTPVVLLTKADTYENAADALLRASETAIGAEVYAVSAVTGEGMDAVRRYFAPGSTVALVGSSGVGKSTLVNAIAGRHVMDTGEVRASDGRGRHTTTYRRMILLPNGARVIDTPGMRSFGVTDAAGVAAAFPDVEAVIAKGCRFRDCTHSGEPGCAVSEALRRGTLSRERWEQYRKLADETERIERGIARHDMFKEKKKERRAKVRRSGKGTNGEEDF